MTNFQQDPLLRNIKRVILDFGQKKAFGLNQRLLEI